MTVENFYRRLHNNEDPDLAAVAEVFKRADVDERFFLRMTPAELVAFELSDSQVRKLSKFKKILLLHALEDSDGEASRRRGTGDSRMGAGLYTFGREVDGKEHELKEVKRVKLKGPPRKPRKARGRGKQNYLKKKERELEGFAEAEFQDTLSADLINSTPSDLPPPKQPSELPPPKPEAQRPSLPPRAQRPSLPPRVQRQNPILQQDEKEKPRSKRQKKRGGSSSYVPPALRAQTQEGVGFDASPSPRRNLERETHLGPHLSPSPSLPDDWPKPSRDATPPPSERKASPTPEPEPRKRRGRGQTGSKMRGW